MYLLAVHSYFPFFLRVLFFLYIFFKGVSLFVEFCNILYFLVTFFRKTTEEDLSVFFRSTSTDPLTEQKQSLIVPLPHHPYVSPCHTHPRLRHLLSHPAVSHHRHATHIPHRHRAAASVHTFHLPYLYIPNRTPNCVIGEHSQTLSPRLYRHTPAQLTQPHTHHNTAAVKALHYLLLFRYTGAIPAQLPSSLHFATPSTSHHRYISAVEGLVPSRHLPEPRPIHVLTIPATSKPYTYPSVPRRRIQHLQLSSPFHSALDPHGSWISH